MSEATLGRPIRLTDPKKDIKSNRTSWSVATLEPPLAHQRGHFDRTVKVYELALTPGLRSPFLPTDELHPESAEKKEEVSAMYPR